MDDIKPPKEQTPEEQQSQYVDEMAGQPQPTDPMATPPVVPPEPTKKSKKKLVITLIVVLLVSLAVAIAVFFFLNTGSEAPETSEETTTSETTVEEEPGTNLYASLANKLYEFDTVTKESAEISVAVPEGGMIKDAYEEDGTWRVIYVLDGAGYLLEQGGEPQKLTTGAVNEYYSAANAKERAFAYTVLPSFEVDVPLVTNTFVAKPGDEVLVYEGNDLTDDNSYLYLIADISEDGSKVLMNKASCFQCDGPITPTALEITVADQSTTEVFNASTLDDEFTAGRLTYGEDSSYLLHQFTHTLGNVEQDAGQYAVIVDGAVSEVIFSYDSTAYTNYKLSNGYNYGMRSEIVAGEIADTSPVFDGIYKVSGSNDSTWEFNLIEGLDINPSTLGSSLNSCMTYAIEDFNAGVRSVAAVCGLETESVTNHAIATVTTDSSAPYVLY